jgi:hypothetical protein
MSTHLIDAARAATLALKAEAATLRFHLGSAVTHGRMLNDN